MKKITRFVDTLRKMFRTASIGAYFAPMFRPIVTEQDRMQLVRITQETDEANRLRSLRHNQS